LLRRRGTPRHRPRGLPGSVRAVPVATAGDYISTGVGGSKLAGQGRSAGDTIDEAVTAVSRRLNNFSKSVNDSINAYNATENDATVSFRYTFHDGPAMTMDDLRRMREEQ